MSIVNPVLGTEIARPLELGYAEPGLSRELTQTKWATAALACAGLTAIYSLVCTAGVFQARGWDALGWLVVGFIGNWVGTGLGLICGLVGCLQRRRLRARAAHSLWVNAMVAATPVTLLGVAAQFDGAADVTPVVNVFAAWAGAFLGIVSGVILGFWYHRPDWLGGYASWPRRLLRLGHLSFFGVAALNLGYALTVASLGWEPPHHACSIALAAANFLMPLACALVAWRPALRHLFVVPVVCTALGVGGLLWTQIVSSLL